MSQKPTLTISAGATIANNQNSFTAGAQGPLLMQDYQLLEKLAHQNHERIPERTVHAKGWGAFGTFTVTHDITRFTKARIFSEVGKQTEMLARFSTVAGEADAADAEREARIVDPLRYDPNPDSREETMMSLLETSRHGPVTLLRMSR